jgi:DNA polymerase-3 subunit alpha
MKVLETISTKPGLSDSKAKEIWEAFEKNGAYQFNKSHSVAYSLISYQSMFMKTHYPAQFFAAALTILGDDKHQGLVKDALSFGIRILPPDVNISTNRIEIRQMEDGTQVLYAPFSAVKGCSENGCQAIMRARAKVGGHLPTSCSLKRRLRSAPATAVYVTLSIESVHLPASSPAAYQPPQKNVVVTRRNSWAIW